MGIEYLSLQAGVGLRVKMVDVYQFHQVGVGQKVEMVAGYQYLLGGAGQREVTGIGTYPPRMVLDRRARW